VLPAFPLVPTYVYRPHTPSRALLAAPANGSPDLDDVTFERTTLHGQRVPASVRSLIRNAAAERVAAVDVVDVPLCQISFALLYDAVFCWGSAVPTRQSRETKAASSLSLNSSVP
jgi:hypothetical protein